MRILCWFALSEMNYYSKNWIEKSHEQLHHRWRRTTGEGYGSSIWHEESGLVSKHYHILHSFSGQWKVISLNFDYLNFGFQFSFLAYSFWQDVVNFIFFHLCRKDDIDVGLMILSQARKDSVAPNLVMCRCLVGKFNWFCFSIASMHFPYMNLWFLSIPRKWILPSCSMWHSKCVYFINDDFWNDSISIMYLDHF